MTHLDEEHRERLLHGELPRDAEDSARAHLAACPDCRRGLEDSARELQQVQALLEALDDAPPAVDLAVVIRPRRSTLRRAAPVLQWAAGLALFVAAAAGAYAWPGSPVPAWLSAVNARFGGGPPHSTQPASPPPAPLAEPPESGIAVLPGRDFLIRFAAPQVVGEVRVTLVEGREIEVRAPVGAARFTSNATRLLIDNHGSQASFEVAIPRAAPRVEIIVGDERVLLKEGARVTGAANADGSYLISLPR